MKQEKSHLLFLDGLRAITAIYVVLHHISLQYFNNHSLLNNYTLFQQLTIKPLLYGHYAVDLFIVLSGYSLMLAVTKNNYILKGGSLLFYKRRIVRILPPYYFAMLLSLVLIWLFIGKKTGLLWDVCIPVNTVDIVRHIFLIHDFFLSSIDTINHVFWSISVEFRIYLFFPLLVWLWKKFNPGVTFLISLLITVIGSVVLIYLNRTDSDINIMQVGVSPYIILFTCGMFAADISFSATEFSEKFRAFFQNLTNVVVLIASVLFLAFYIAFVHILDKKAHSLTQSFISDQLEDVLIGIFYGVILIYLTFNANSIAKSSWITKLFSWQPIVFLGTFSYSLYLVHAPLIQVLTQYVTVPLKLNPYYSTVLILVVGTPIIVGTAYLFFLLFEKPFLTGNRKLKEKAIEITAINNPAP